MTLVVSETSTLVIYQNTSVKWSAQLQFLPICIARAFLRTLWGAVVLLSEEGRLECCYLGTDPSLFVAPPLNAKEIDFEQAESELATLNKIIKNAQGNGKKLVLSTIKCRPKNTVLKALKCFIRFQMFQN